MEKLAELFFELANQDRLQILHELASKKMKLTEVSKELELTAQETSRHLARLNNALLVTKISDGSYILTKYGYQILDLLPSYRILLENREYFSTHSLSCLPQGYASRIGELLGSQSVDNAIVLFQMVDALIAEAERFIWIMSDQALTSTFSLLIDAMNKGVTFRTILPEGLGPPSIPPEMLPDFGQFRNGPMDNRHLDSIDAVVIVSEKTGIVAFKSQDEKMDYEGFVISGELGIQWCKDLFTHYWELGTGLSDDQWEGSPSE